MGLIGGLLGQAAGAAAGGYFGGKQGSSAGQQIGGVLGGLLPFKNGGKVGHTGPALVHKGEFVLPAGVKPTAAQKKAVRARGGRV